MQIVIYFGGARSLWGALFVYFLFVKNQHFFWRHFWSDVAAQVFFFFFWWVISILWTMVCQMFVIFQLLFCYFIFRLPSLLLHIGFGCMWSENFMAISVLRVFAYLHVSSQMKREIVADQKRFYPCCYSNRWFRV